MALLCWLLSGFFVLIVLRHSRVSHAGTVWTPQNVKLGIFDHTVAVQWRNVQKRAMHKQCCCFANLNLSLFAFLVEVAVVYAAQARINDDGDGDFNTENVT